MTAQAAASPLVISNFSALREADLVALWEGQGFPAAAVRTRDGRAFRVVYRGRRTGGPGPDFRDALIATREELLNGDVELHVRSSDFRRHGHHRDLAYDGVVLHVVFGHDEPADTELACGRRVPVVALGEAATGGAGELSGWLAQPPLWREPCCTAVERIGAAGSGAALDRLGDMRFRQKTAAVERALRAVAPGRRGRAAEELAWDGLLEALGYGGQRELMLAVAAGVPWPGLRAELAGKPAGARKAIAMRLLSQGLAEEGLRAPLVLRPVRPGNGAQARIAGAAALAARFAPAGIRCYAAPYVAEAAAGHPARLVRAFTVPAAIGRARAVEIISNALLPVLAAAGDEAIAEAAYRALPLPARYGPVRHIHAALGGQVPLTARRQQGMLYLLKQYCTQGGCGRCPLS